MEWALHCAVVMAMSPVGTAISANKLAEDHGVGMTYLAKALQAMSRAGLVISVVGRGGGYRLARSPSEITLLDVVQALEGRTTFFRCAEIRRNLPARRKSQVCSIAKAMYQAESAWREELRAVSLADIAADVRRLPLG